MVQLRNLMDSSCLMKVSFYLFYFWILANRRFNKNKGPYADGAPSANKAGGGRVQTAAPGDRKNKQPLEENSFTKKLKVSK